MTMKSMGVTIAEPLFQFQIDPLPSFAEIFHSGIAHDGDNGLARCKLFS